MLIFQGNEPLEPQKYSLEKEKHRPKPPSLGVYQNFKGFKI